jgi:hypothetical protein
MSDSYEAVTNVRIHDVDLTQDNNGALLVTGVPFTGDVNFDGDISQVGSQNVPLVNATLAVAATKALPTVSAVAFSDGTNLQVVDSTHPLPVDVDVQTSADLETIDGIQIAGVQDQFTEALMPTAPYAFSIDASTNLQLYQASPALDSDDSLARLLTSSSLVGSDQASGFLTPITSHSGTDSASNPFEALDGNVQAWGSSAVAPAGDAGGGFVGPYINAMVMDAQGNPTTSWLTSALTQNPGDVQINVTDASYAMGWALGYPVAGDALHKILAVADAQAVADLDFIATGNLSINGTGLLMTDHRVRAVWDGTPGTSTFTATLEGSFTGAWAGEQVILKTLTESNLTDVDKDDPWPYTRLNLSALSLDTATGVHLYGASK